MLLVLLFLTWFWFSLPGQLFDNPTSFVISDKDGQLLNATIADDGQWRFPFNNDVPEKFTKCIIAYEDKRFFYHPGIDVLAMARAVKLNLANKKVTSGASTITMQVIRLQQKNGNRGIVTKIKETLLAIRLECSYRKKSILALYASNAPFGSNVVGLDAASWRYFGRSASQLSWGEVATLAVLPNAPSVVHPGRNRNVLKKKRDDLLWRLVEQKQISKEEALLASQEPIPSAPRALPQLAPHLLQRFKKDYKALNNKDHFAPTALTTTIDGLLQQQVNELVQRYHQQWRGNQVNNACALVVEVQTGNVLSYVGNVPGSREADIESHVDILSSRRSPGSTLKPLLYTYMLSEGIILPDQLVPDVPTRIGGISTRNFDLGYDGAIPASKALARSLNIPAVKMLQQFKHQRFYHGLKSMGFTTLDRPADQYGLSLVLGGCEIIPYELAGVYASMARCYNNQIKNKGALTNEDWHMPLYSNSLTKQSKTPPPFNYPALYNTFLAMNEVQRPGEEGLWTNFSSAQRIAWKTGTSFGFRDAWSVGVTPKYCVLVWVGNADGEGRPDLTGINTAAPLMFDIFRLLPASAFFVPPAIGFTYQLACKESGFKAGAECTETTPAICGNDNLKATLCPYHMKVNLDPTASFRVSSQCISPFEMRQQSFFVLPPVMEFYYRQRHPGYKLLPPFLPGCETVTTKALDFVYPEPNARIFVPVELNGERGKTVFTATNRSANGKLFWHLDNHLIATTENIHQVALDPSVGKHIITIINESGESVSRQFEMLKKL